MSTCVRHIVLGSLLSAATSPSAAQVWVQNFGTPLEETFNSLICTADDDIVAVGYATYEEGTARDVLVARFDSSGVPRWWRVYGGAGDDEARAVVETDNRDLVVVGYTRSRGDGADFLLSRFSASGSLLWTRYWGGEGDEELTAVMEAASGTLWATGYTESYEPVGRQKVILVCIPPSGSPLTCARVTNLPDNWTASGVALTEVPDFNAIYVAGDVTDHDPLGFGSQILLARFDDSPALRRAWRLGQTNQSYTATTLVGTADGCLAMAGNVCGWNGPYLSYGSFILKTGLSAQVAWGCYCLGLGPYSSFRLWGLLATQDDGLVATGYECGYLIGPALLLAKWNLAGTLLWSRGSAPGVANGLAVAEAADGYLLVGGSTESGNGQLDGLLARSSLSGLTCETPDSGPMFDDWTPSRAEIVLASATEVVPAERWYHSFRTVPAVVNSICSPRVRTVCPYGSAEFRRIQDAIDAAADTDVIELCPGHFTGPGNYDLDFGGKRVIVRSRDGDPETCIIECEQGARGFYFHNAEERDSVVSGVTITGGCDPGVLCVGAAPTIQRCRFIDCHGAIVCDDASPAIRECVIESSSASAVVGSGSPIIEACWIGRSAGAAVEWYSGAPRIEDSLIYCNHDGLAFAWSQAAVSGCTIADNDGAGLSFSNTALDLRNAIVWRNLQSVVIYPTQPPSSHLEATCSDIEGGWPGTNNIAADPQFCDRWPCGDYYLRGTSPCRPGQQPECGLIGALGVGCESPEPRPAVPTVEANGGAGPPAVPPPPPPGSE